MLCLVAVLCGCAAHSNPPSRSAGSGAGWTEVVTEHFVLSSNLQPPLALDMAHALEETRHALVTLAWTGARQLPRGRTDVVVFARPSEFSRYSGQLATVAGVAVTRAGYERLLSFSPGANNGLPEVAVHEIGHDVTQWFMPLMPAWLSEGMATWMESLTLDRETRRASLGSELASRLQWLKSTTFVVRSANLFARDTFQHEDARNAASFYSSAWMLVDYLLNRRAEQFGLFQRRLARLEPWREAWDAEFPGLTLDALDQEIVAYRSKRHEFDVIEGVIPAPPIAPRTRALSSAEVHGVLARMSFLVGNLELAEQERSEAARLDPTELNALIVRHELVGAGAAQARLDIARQAVSAHPTSAAAWLLLAESGADDSERWAGLSRASELAPDHPAVRTRLAQLRLANQDPKGALEHSRVALRRSAYSGELLELHVRILAANRRCEEAERLERNLEGLVNESCRVTLQNPPRTVSCVDRLRELWAESGCAR